MPTPTTHPPTVWVDVKLRELTTHLKGAHDPVEYEQVMDQIDTVLDRRNRLTTPPTSTPAPPTPAPPTPAPPTPAPPTPPTHQ